MIPSRTWFPTNIQDRAAWSDNFAKQFALLAVSLGVSLKNVCPLNAKWHE